MSLHEEVDMLRRIPLFAQIEGPKLKLIAFTSERVAFDAGHTLFRQGDAANAAYVIVEGKAEVIVETPGGPVVVAVLGPNDFFGEIAILCDVPRTASVRADTRLTTLRISKELFLRLIKEFPTMAVSIMRELAHRLEATNNQLRTEHAELGAPSPANALADVAYSPGMSRLDSFIRRMMAQRACLDRAADLVKGVPGPVLELGLGNGRTYDHMRELMPKREIYVFEREVAAHSDCVPPSDYLILGDARETLPMMWDRLPHSAALAHIDMGTGDAGGQSSACRRARTPAGAAAQGRGDRGERASDRAARLARAAAADRRARGPVSPLPRGLASRRARYASLQR